MNSEVYLESSKMELFVKVVNGFKHLILQKS